MTKQEYKDSTQEAIYALPDGRPILVGRDALMVRDTLYYSNMNCRKNQANLKLSCFGSLGDFAPSSPTGG